MENLGIQTSQNVYIKSRLASIGERIGATVLDYVVIAAYIIIIMLIIDALNISSHSAVYGFLMFIIFFPVIFYALLSEIFLNGQSVGKKVLKIKVVKLDGTQPSIVNYIVRWVFRLIDLRLLSGIVALITIAINGKGQRIGDIVAGTSVITLKRKESLEKTIYIAQEKNYKLIYPEADFLEESDIKTIKEVLDNYKRNSEKTVAKDYVMMISEAIEKKINRKRESTPLSFLKQIMADYNYVNTEKKDNF